MSEIFVFSHGELTGAKSHDTSHAERITYGIRPTGKGCMALDCKERSDSHGGLKQPMEKFGL